MYGHPGIEFTGADIRRSARTYIFSGKTQDQFPNK
jgi:hypothetical protein